LSQNASIVVLVSGRGTNLQALIEASISGRIRSQIRAVISNKVDAIALERAKTAGIPTQVIPSRGVPRADFEAALSLALDTLKPDFIVLAGFMLILPPEIIATWKDKIINIHPSLLPSFPGLHAQKQALAYGVKVTGCTAHLVDAGCDTGPVLVQKTLPIFDDDTEETLSARLLPLEHEALINAIALLENQKILVRDRRTLLVK
jgi:phosphoribosylglycinamide formyltransferase-1